MAKKSGKRKPKTSKLTKKVLRGKRVKKKGEKDEMGVWSKENWTDVEDFKDMWTGKFPIARPVRGVVKGTWWLGKKLLWDLPKFLIGSGRRKDKDYAGRIIEGPGYGGRDKGYSTGRVEEGYDAGRRARDYAGRRKGRAA